MTERRFKVIEGENEKKGYRFRTDGAEVWVCPVCRARGDGDRLATIEIRPMRYIGKGGRKMRSPKIEVCDWCWHKYDRITEV